MVVGADGTMFVAEVKILMPTAEEEAEIARCLSGEVFATGVKPGERLRRLIGKRTGRSRGLPQACPQSWSCSTPRYSCIDTPIRTRSSPQCADSDVIDVEMPHDRAEPPRFGDVRSGPGRR